MNSQTMPLSLKTLDRLPPAIARPRFDPRALKPGILHLGVGNFHRAHQAVYTEDAIAKRGGDWGIVGVSLRRPDMPQLLAPQDNLYTVETLAAERSLRVMGVHRTHADRARGAHANSSRLSPRRRSASCR